MAFLTNTMRKPQTLFLLFVLCSLAGVVLGSGNEQATEVEMESTNTELKDVEHIRCYTASETESTEDDKTDAEEEKTGVPPNTYDQELSNNTISDATSLPAPEIHFMNPVQTTETNKDSITHANTLEEYDDAFNAEIVVPKPDVMVSVLDRIMPVSPAAGASSDENQHISLNRDEPPRQRRNTCCKLTAGLAALAGISILPLAWNCKAELNALTKEYQAMVVEALVNEGDLSHLKVRVTTGDYVYPGSIPFSTNNSTKDFLKENFEENIQQLEDGSYAIKPEVKAGMWAQNPAHGYEPVTGNVTLRLQRSEDEQGQTDK